MLASLDELLTANASTGRYLSGNQLNEVARFLQHGSDSLKAASFFTNNSSTLVADSLRKFIDQQPSLVGLGGILNDQAKLAACIRDLDLFLRFISYCVIAGNSTILEDNLLNDMREIYTSLGVSLSLMITAIRLLRDETIKGLAQENYSKPVQDSVSDYFKLIIEALQ
jgi:phycocyanin beta chain